MSSLSSSSEWSLLIYRVRDADRQQRILRAFHRIAWPGVAVLGTQDAMGVYVIVDCESTSLERHARRIIMRIDTSAVRVLRSVVPHAATAP
ncbi:hypothetical protein [Aeromicrobium sp. 9AM]|uniref:hypothetical protein n=1 Tax=Aeromicrobium sp. 9AM TaxID=2653126 RepID=UPI0012F38189|nr:hypothetical protein [Aeromicrobium sp. 9AM]VXC44505.1 conserved hypothetical protein [Aeromicrobium sp. 9AM]